MAAKGAQVKVELMKKMLEVFPDSFTPDDKEIRIDMVENGNPVQIKVTLTAVKIALSNSQNLEVIDEEQFRITDDEKVELEKTLGEMGIEF